MADALEKHALEDVPLYAYPDVRQAWTRLTHLFDPGYLTRLIFEPRAGTNTWKQNNSLSLRKIVEDSVGKFVLGPDVHPLPPQRSVPGALTSEQAREFPHRRLAESTST